MWTGQRISFCFVLLSRKVFTVSQARVTSLCGAIWPNYSDDQFAFHVLSFCWFLGCVYYVFLKLFEKRASHVHTESAGKGNEFLTDSWLYTPKWAVPPTRNSLGKLNKHPSHLTIAQNILEFLLWEFQFMSYMKSQAYLQSDPIFHCWLCFPAWFSTLALNGFAISRKPNLKRRSLFRGCGRGYHISQRQSHRALQNLG